jgi:hypothetical protein
MKVFVPTAPTTNTLHLLRQEVHELCLLAGRKTRIILPGCFCNGEEACLLQDKLLLAVTGTSGLKCQRSELNQTTVHFRLAYKLLIYGLP